MIEQNPVRAAAKGAPQVYLEIAQTFLDSGIWKAKKYLTCREFVALCEQKFPGEPFFESGNILRMIKKDGFCAIIKPDLFTDKKGQRGIYPGEKAVIMRRVLQLCQDEHFQTFRRGCQDPSFKWVEIQNQIRSELCRTPLEKFIGTQEKISDPSLLGMR